jgi:type VI protein secretion system component Hcp
MSVCYVEFSKPIDNYTEVLSFSYGMGSSNVLAGTSRKASVQDVNFLMDVNSMYQRISQASMAGIVFDTVWVEFYKSGDSNEPYLVSTLSSVVVASVSAHRGKVDVGLNFKTMKSEYFR